MKPNVPSENLLKNCLTHHTDSALGTLRKVKTGSTGGLWSSGGIRLKFCMWGGMISWSRAGWVAPGQKDLGVAVIIKLNMSRSAPAIWIRQSAYWATLVEVRSALTFACAWTCHSAQHWQAAPGVACPIFGSQLKRSVRKLERVHLKANKLFRSLEYMAYNKWKKYISVSLEKRRLRHSPKAACFLKKCC